MLFNVCLGVVVIALIGIVIRQELVIDRLDNDIERIAEAHNKNADALIKTIKELKEHDESDRKKRTEIYDRIGKLELKAEEGVKK